VTEFATVKQQVSPISVKFDDTAVADYFDRQVDLGRKPEQFARIWLHTHPADLPAPSGLDEETFSKVFGGCQWAVMFILAEDNKTYVRLQFNVGPGGQVLIPVEVDYSAEFGPSSHELWDAEYAANIEAAEWFDTQLGQDSDRLYSYTQPCDFIDEFEKLEPAQRQLILDELAQRPNLWDQESEVMFR